ncbi:MAG: roadblock/LC7 domain-containing protein, partial [Candidatus Odinarchaeia archaeon]
AAMTAAMLSLGERAAAELNKGELEQVYIKGKEGYVVAMGAGDNAVLTLSASKDAKLGMIFLEMERAAKKIAELV